MKIHYIKAWPEFFGPVKKKKKQFEMRKNDRDYKEGDILVLQEWNMGGTGYTGKECVRVVTFILTEGFGLMGGYCCMSVRRSRWRSFQYWWHKRTKPKTEKWEFKGM